MMVDGLRDLVAAMGWVPYVATLAAVTALSAGLAYYSFRRLQYLRLIEDTPTARVRSAAQGFVELEGEARPLRGRPLASPLRGRPCVWWSYRIEDFAEAAPGDGAAGSPWALPPLLARVLQIRGSGRLVEAARSREPFLIRDESGACVVDPEEAHVFEARSEAWVLGSKRFEEAVIVAGAPLYALGLFRTPRDYADELERREVGALVSAWKLDRLALAERFDANRDGEIDAQEWEATWRAAAAEIRERRRREPFPTLHVLCDPADRRPFILSVLGQRRLASRFWFQSLTSLLLAVALALIAIWSLRARGLV